MKIIKMTSSVQRTPISLLQELCVQQCITAEYKLMSVEGAVHAPTFMYRVQVGNKVATATGASKKKAKHAAAKTVLEKLLTKEGDFASGFITCDGAVVNADTLPDIITGTVTGECVDNVLDDDVQGNPVGALQELCMRRHWQPPNYETQKESGLPHERTFTIACQVDRFSEIGIGKSKRLAKRQAADRMLKKLEVLEPKDEKDSTKINDEKANENDPLQNTTYKSSTIQSLYYDRVQEFLDDLKAVPSPCLTELLELDLTDENLDCIKFLERIGTEQDFKVTYLPLAQKGKSGQYHCLVEINSLPIAVCFGMGDNREEAQANSARNALNFIQIMCKR